MSCKNGYFPHKTDHKVPTEFNFLCLELVRDPKVNRT